MAIPGRNPSVPEDWYVDPVNLGVPGVRRNVGDDNPLAWPRIARGFSEKSQDRA